MNPGVLRIVGQVAGIGGLALGVFLILFRQLIQKSIFARLTKPQSQYLITLFMLLTFFVTLAGIAAWICAQYLAISSRKGVDAAIARQGQLILGPNPNDVQAPSKMDQSARELINLLNLRATRILEGMKKGF